MQKVKVACSPAERFRTVEMQHPHTRRFTLSRIRLLTKLWLCMSDVICMCVCGDR